MHTLRSRVIVTVVLSAGLAACGSSAHTSKIDSAVTAQRVGPISLGEPRAKVEAVAGKGQFVRAGKRSQGTGTVLIAYPAVSIRVIYLTRHGKAAAFVVETTSSNYRTKSGIGVGSTVEQVKKIGADCASECVLKNASAGTETDFALDNRGMRVIRLSVGPLFN